MSSLDTGNVLGIFAILFSIGGVIYTAVNHKRFRLKCCGKDLDVSVDVEDTSPPAQTTKQTKPKALSLQEGNEKENEDEDEEEDEDREDREDRKERGDEENKDKDREKQDKNVDIRSNSQGNINGTNKTPFKEKAAKVRERERERRVSVSQQQQISLRDQNIDERERSEALKANYALRVAEARRYNYNQRRIAPFPPLPPLPLLPPPDP